MNVKGEIIGVIIALEITLHEELYLPVTGDRFLLTGLDWPGHTVQNDFEVWEGQSPGSFVIVCGSEALFLYVCVASHIYMHYLLAERKTCAEMLYLGEVAIPPYSIFSYMGTCSMEHVVGGALTV